MSRSRASVAVLAGVVAGAAVSACGGGPDPTGPSATCRAANTYAFRVASMNGQVGTQPNGDDLRNALSEASRSAARIAEDTDGRTREDATRTSEYWTRMTERWRRFDFDARQVTQADLPGFAMPGYRAAGERLLRWTVETCSDEIRPFPQAP